MQVAAADAFACHHQLARCTLGNQAQVGVDHIQLVIIQRPPDERRVIVAGNLVEGGVNGTLRRAIAIIEVKCRLLKRHQFLTACRQQAQRLVADDRGEHRAYLRGHEGDIDSVRFHVAVHGHYIHAHLAGYDIDGGSHRQCRVYIHHVGIKSEVGVTQGMVSRCHAELLDVPVAEVHNAVVFQCHTLRFAR